MADVANAYRLCIGIFKQSSTGTAFAALPDDYGSIKWDLVGSIIPAKYDFTNLQIGGSTIETVEKNTITAMTKAKQFDSGALTPPTIQLATLLPADAASIIDTLAPLDVADPFKVLVTAGAYASAGTRTRVYDVFWSAAAILTEDGGRSGEAKQLFNGNLALQSCHLPLLTTATNNAKLTWTTSTNVISFAVNPAQSGGGT